MRYVSKLSISKCELEFTNIKLIAFFDSLGIDSISLEFDAVGGIEVFDVILAIFEEDGAVFTGNIAVANDEVGELRGTADDIFVFIDGIFLVCKDDVKRRLSESGLRCAWILRRGHWLCVHSLRAVERSEYHGLSAIDVGGLFKDGRRTFISRTGRWNSRSLRRRRKRRRCRCRRTLR